MNKICTALLFCKIKKFRLTLNKHVLLMNMFSNNYKLAHLIGDDG